MGKNKCFNSNNTKYRIKPHMALYSPIIYYSIQKRSWWGWKTIYTTRKLEEAHKKLKKFKKQK
jgi:hypothetical protein